MEVRPNPDRRIGFDHSGVLEAPSITEERMWCLDLRGRILSCGFYVRKNVKFQPIWGLLGFSLDPIQAIRVCQEQA